MKVVYISFNQKENIKIPVLIYHGMKEELPESDPFDFQYINTPQHFEENMKTLIKHGFRTISLKELYNAVKKGKRLPKKPVVITFDDGFEEQYTLAYPVIKKLLIKAVIFVTTDLVGKEVDGVRYFGWDDANKMQKSGFVEICSHGKRHINYTAVPIDEFKDDILKSFEVLEENLGKAKVKSFAYPFGLYNEQMVDILESSGIDIQADGLGINHLKTIDLSLLKRINIPYTMSGDQIVSYITVND